MRFLVFILLLLSIGIWGGLILLQLDVLPTNYIPTVFRSLKGSSSFAELGSSVGIIEGFFSSVAIVLALVAVMFQSREMQQSTKAQNLQAQAMVQQLKRHDQSVLIHALNARLQLLYGRIDWYENLIDRLTRERDSAKKAETSEAKQKKIENCQKKVKQLRAEVDSIEPHLEPLIRALTNSSTGRA